MKRKAEKGGKRCLTSFEGSRARTAAYGRTGNAAWRIHEKGKERKKKRKGRRGKEREKADARIGP
jgi:hypothetical protein